VFPSKCGEGVEGENALFAAFRGEPNLTPSSRWDVELEDVQVLDLLLGEMCPDLFDKRAIWID